MSFNKYLLITTLLTVIFPAIAQQPERFSLEPVTPTQRTAIVRNLQRGAIFTSNGRSYQHLSDAQASLARGGESLANTRQRLNVNSDDVVETKGRYVFYRAPSSAPALQRRGDEHAFPVALNTGTGRLGFLPGTIAITLKDMSQAEAVAASHGLKLERTFPHLGLAYFKASEGQNVLTAAASVASDARVTRAEPEVVEHINVPH